MKRYAGWMVFILVLAFVFASHEEAFSQPFPTKPLNIIVPFTPGGAVDTTIRIISEEAEKSLGQKILVINKPGAGAAEGQGFVARSKADGYTLLAMTSSVVTNTLTKKVDFTIDSFDPVILYNFDPEVMFVYSGSPYQNLEDLINQGKKEPVLHVTPGHSTSHHVASLILEKKTGTKFKYVHTKGGTEQIPMVAGGHGVCFLGVWGEARSMVEQGKLRPLGVMSKERDPRFPNIPTFKEKGWDIEYGAWRGISGPKGMPQDVIQKLYPVFKKALETPEVRDKFKKADYSVMIQGPEAFLNYIKTDFESIKQILSVLK